MAMLASCVTMATVAGCATTGAESHHYVRVPSHVCRPSSENGDGYGCDEIMLNARTLRVTAVHPTEVTARQWALVRTAEVAVALRYRGFTVVADDSHEMDTVRSRFVVGRVKRKTPVAVLTVSLLSDAEFAQVPPGTMAYDARLLAGTAK